ncbi:hypothetical protein AB1Y20_008775 [Prymnesium parvum]|uniref:Methyltransferase type 11 domain-containing protein n=1 Tax=Prymnesium parvum TaxID=97485 RepID=A0AB34ISH2_PRYPA
MACRRASLQRAPRRALSIHVFDRALKRQHRERAALDPEAPRYAYLRDEVAHRLIDRLDDVSSAYSFPLAADVGAGTGHVRRALAGRGVRHLTEYDLSPAMLAAASASAAEFAVEQSPLDEESSALPREAYDLVTSSMALHWVNDLPAALTALRRALKPDGFFLGAMLGGDTLCEMRSAFVLADLERRGGVAQHMSPLCSVADAGALVQAAGFALPTVDTEVITIHYPDAWTLWHHLRAMGESHATRMRERSDRDTLLAAAAIYRELYGDEEGNIPATFQVIYMAGWSPHESQQKPLPRGSGAVSLKDLELPGGIQLPPDKPDA